MNPRYRITWFTGWISVWIVGTIALAGWFFYRADGHFHFGTGRGEAGSFILQQAILATAHPAKTNGLPALTNSWRYARDQYGVIVWLARNDYSQVESFLREAFDPPGWRNDLNAGSNRARYFRLSDKGGAISVTQNTNSTEVIVVRPISERELGKALRETVRPDLVARIGQRGLELIRSIF